MTTSAETPALRRRAEGKKSDMAERAASGATLNSVIAWLFMVFLALPIIFYAGTLRLSPYRVVLIIAMIPCLITWLSSKEIRVRAPDVLLILSLLWSGLAIVVHHGVAIAVVPIGILFIETVGAYLLARCLVRDASGFESMARALFTVVVVLLPFAAIEAVTGRAVLITLFDMLFSVHPFVVDRAPRWGLRRVQGPFEHPILFGVFCSAAFALSLYVLGYNKGRLAQFVKPGLVGAAVFFSLSSGPLSAVLAQGAVAVWERVTRRITRRWVILFVGFAIVYVAIDLLSNRTPIEVFISRTAFNAQTAYGRILIWQYGSAQVASSPLFGVGYGDWERAWFMTGSMDMFWLVIPVRYGLPAGLTFSLAVLLVLINVGRLRIADPRLASYRLGFVVTMVGLILAGWTVHFWNATYVLFIFLLGSGVWMLDAGGENAAGGRATKEIQPNSGRSRKPVKLRAQPSSRPSAAPRR